MKKAKEAEKQPEKVILEALRNTTLADGTFVAKGKQVEVDAIYADRVEQEKDKSFKKIN